jgi:hypothetical protein
MNGPQKPFTSAEGKFSILMPGRPEITNHSFTVERGAVGYNVFYTDLHDQPAETETLPDEVRDELRKLGTILKERQVQQGSHPGWEVEIRPAALGPGSLSRSRAFVAGRRLYLTSVAGPEKEVRSMEADEFLDSFNINE